MIYYESIYDDLNTNKNYIISPNEEKNKDILRIYQSFNMLIVIVNYYFYTSVAVFKYQRVDKYLLVFFLLSIVPATNVLLGPLFTML